MEDFKPIEQLFPHWLTARVFVASHLPNTASVSTHIPMRRPRSSAEEQQQEELRQDAFRQGLVYLNGNWMQQILDFTPPEYEVRMTEQLNKVNQILLQECPDLVGVQTTYELLTGTTLRRISTQIQQDDVERSMRQKPTTREIIAYVLGIADFVTSISITMSITHFPQEG